MHRFYLPPQHASGTSLTLTGGEAHHALHVLRVRSGETAMVLDGAGQEYRCEVESCGRQLVGLRVLEQRQVAPPPFQVTLVQGLPKGKLIEAIIQKATELGAYRVVPLLSERVVIRLDKKEAAAKALKWQAVAIEAIKQCGSAWLTKVEAPIALADYLARADAAELAFVGSLKQSSKHPRLYFEDFLKQRNRKPRTVSVWVGPEGDFTPAEVEMIQARGVLPITLGPLVLRSETAALYCLSVVNYELQNSAPFPRASTFSKLQAE
jgi:16S rRNA (uracil1498-N3)-methyltransferase